MHKKNLLIVVPALQIGGQERAAVNTADIMSNIYYITFVIFDGTDAVYAPSCPVIDLKIPASANKIKKILNALRRALVLRKIKREQKIDFTMSFGTTANLANVLSGHIGKTIISLRGYASIKNGFLDRIMYNKCDKIICICKGLCTSLSKIAPSHSSKVDYLYNPHDIVSVLAKGQEPVLDYEFSDYTIVAHGRLHEIKNFPRLIKAFSLVHSQIPDAKLLIIGEGSERLALQTLIEKYKLQDSATLLGFRRNPFAYLAKSTLYVLSSFSEGFSFSLVEGLTFLPAVSVDCKCGPREILSDADPNRRIESIEEAKYGILVRPASSREFNADLTDEDRILADAILLMLSDPDKLNKYKKLGNKRAYFFSTEKYKDKLGAILKECYKEI